MNLPEGLVSLGPGAFGFNYNLGNVKLPSTLQEIGDGCFSNCKNITTVTLPPSLTYIGNQAFHDIPGLETVVSLIEEPFDIEDAFLISGRKDIGYFTNTEAVLYIPAGTKEKYKAAKGWNLFHPMLEPGTTANEYEEAGVVYLYETDWPEAMVKRGTKNSTGSPNASGNIIIKDSLSIDGRDYPVTEIGTFAFSDNNEIESVLVPSSVASIGEGAFANCSSLSTVILPPSIKIIRSGLFDSCTKLQEVYLTNSIEEIWWCAFRNCTSLQELKLPDQLMLLGVDALRGCTALKSILIPKTVIAIGTQALSGCMSLDSFVVEDGNPIYDSRDNCNGLILTQRNELVWGFKKTTIPHSVTSIGDEAFAFSDLQSIVVPPQIDTLKYRAFYGSEHVTSIELPKSNPWIAIEAFRKLPNLQSIISKSPNPENIEEVFDNDAYNNVTVYIPKGSRSAYESHEGWRQFQHIIEVDDIDNIQKFKRKVVVEEGTGTWCEWCPRGIVGIRETSERHPDTFIPIAVHVNDAMQIDSYKSLINQKFAYYPICTMNRKQTFDPNSDYLENYYNIAINSETTSQIAMSAKWMNESKSEVQINTTTTFAYNTSDDYRIAYVITENQVGPYAQKNVYSGGEEGDMGGFENLPSTTYIYHDHVARYISRVNGTHHIVPEESLGKTDYKYSYSMEIPNNIQNLDNIELIVLLINQETMEIENADRITADQIDAYDPTGIHSLKTYTKENDNWYSLDGRRLKNKPNKKGLYIKERKKIIVR